MSKVPTGTDLDVPVDEPSAETVNLPVIEPDEQATFDTSSLSRSPAPPSTRTRPLLRSRFGSLRYEILITFVLLLSLTMAGAMFALRQLLIDRVDDRIEEELQQEVQELRRLSNGRDPSTGRPFNGDIERIFEVFLQRNIPQDDQTMLTLMDGRPFLRPRKEPLYRIDHDQGLIETWSNITEPLRGRADTTAGGFDYLAVPILVDDAAAGVFVTGQFRDVQVGEVDDAVKTAALLSLITLLIGSVLAWRLAEKILRRVGTVSDAAYGISESDLHRRIQVEGRDEIAQMAETFNGMLDRLETAFTMQRAFIDDAGHELRTPITIIRGHLEVMGDDPKDREETKALVLDELDRMARMVDDLLLLAKSEKPDFLHFDTVEVSDLTVALFEKATALAARGWRLEGSGKGRIEADRQKLTQAMMQLAQNAVQHTRDGQPISIGSSVEGGAARFWVSDSGPGIPPAERERIFDRFARARGAFRSSEGAGLGLSIVKAIAEGHHGSVQLDTVVGKGSTFTLVLPVDQPHHDGATT